jgi:hypothetical protein
MIRNKEKWYNTEQQNAKRKQTGNVLRSTTLKDADIRRAING